MAAQSFTKSTGLSTIYSLIYPLQQQRNYQLEKKMIPIPLLDFDLLQAFGAAKGFLICI